MIDNLTLIDGVGDGKQTACLMSARSLLDGRPFGDGHPSAVLRKVGIRINDGRWWDDTEERTCILLPLALDERLCATKCNASPEAERKRADLCAHWALSWAAPFALEQAALALDAKWPEHATTLRGHADKLRADPSRQEALDARDAAHAAAYAADAAADAADDAAKSERKKVRDSLIDLFRELLAVGWKAEEVRAGR